jgi:oligoribonuclease (3'-5' exoribonuclease)
MNTERYRRLNTVTARYSDKHVECMTDWVRKNRRDEAYKEKCRALALKYKKALESELDYLTSRPPSDRIAFRVGVIRDYLNMVADDIAMLDGGRSH